MTDDRDRRIDQLTEELHELREVVNRQQAALDDVPTKTRLGHIEPGATREPGMAKISRSGLLKTATASGLGLVLVGAVAPTIASAETEKSPEVTSSVRVTGPAPKSGIGLTPHPASLPSAYSALALAKRELGFMDRPRAVRE
jgi:hypothetical protein